MPRNGLEQILAARLADRGSRSQLRRLTTFPPSSVDFSSNSYLSLGLVHELRETYLSYLRTCTSSSPPVNPLGSGGSRLLDGNSTLAESLELEIAAFHHAPAGLLFNSGFDANVGLFSCVPQPGDIIVYDELIHASAHEGMKLCRAGQKLPFKHNCVERQDGGAEQPTGRLKSLDGVLAQLVRGDDAGGIKEGKTSVFVAVEGVYSMDGDVAPLREIAACLKRRLPRGNGHLIVDEAHSTGLFGENGRGLVCELGLEDSVFARLHTFGKALGCSGAIVLCSATTREYLINYARTLIYTTAMPASSLASIKVVYDFLTSGRADILKSNLQDLVEYAHSLLLAVCERHGMPSDLLRVAPVTPKSPIIPVLTSAPRHLAAYCQERGFVVRPIVAPTVPKGSERVRVCLHAANTRAEIEGLSKVIEEWVLSQKRRDRKASAGRPHKPRL